MNEQTENSKKDIYEEEIFDSVDHNIPAGSDC
jgi:hypothetical protein